MSHFTNIVKKEIRELITPSTFIPIIIMALLFGSIGNMMGGAIDEAQKTPLVGLVISDTGLFSPIVKQVVVEQAKICFNGSDATDLESGISRVKELDGTALLYIPANFSDDIEHNQTGIIEVYWIMKGAGIMDMISSNVLENLISSIDYRITEELVKVGNINATFALMPTKKIDSTIFKDKTMNNVSPSVIGNLIQSQSTTVPIIMMIIIIMAGGMVISSMSMEKENKTLETLLTLPVKRTSIVAGKIVGSAAVGLMMAIIYMIGFGYYIQSFQVSSDLNLADYGLTLNFTDYILIGTSVFFSLLAALSLCMVLGTFAKNYKSAQTLTVPVSILAVIPMFLIMFKDFDTLPVLLKILLFAIPFSHPMMAMRSLLFGNYVFTLIGILYAAIFALIMIAIAVWIFKTDKLLTGRIQHINSKRFRFHFLKPR